MEEERWWSRLWSLVRPLWPALACGILLLLLNVILSESMPLTWGFQDGVQMPTNTVQSPLQFPRSVNVLFFSLAMFVCGCLMWVNLISIRLKSPRQYCVGVSCLVLLICFIVWQAVWPYNPIAACQCVFPIMFLAIVFLVGSSTSNITDRLLVSFLMMWCLLILATAVADIQQQQNTQTSTTVFTSPVTFTQPVDFSGTVSIHKTLFFESQLPLPSSSSSSARTILSSSSSRTTIGSSAFPITTLVSQTLTDGTLTLTNGQLQDWTALVGDVSSSYIQCTNVTTTNLSAQVLNITTLSVSVLTDGTASLSSGSLTNLRELDVAFYKYIINYAISSVSESDVGIEEAVNQEMFSFVCVWDQVVNLTRGWDGETALVIANVLNDPVFSSNLTICNTGFSELTIRIVWPGEDEPTMVVLSNNQKAILNFNEQSGIVPMIQTSVVDNIGFLVLESNSGLTDGIATLRHGSFSSLAFLQATTVTDTFATLSGGTLTARELSDGYTQLSGGELQNALGAEFVDVQLEGSISSFLVSQMPPPTRIIQITHTGTYTFSASFGDSIILNGNNAEPAMIHLELTEAPLVGSMYVSNRGAGSKFVQITWSTGEKSSVYALGGLYGLQSTGTVAASSPYFSIAPSALAVSNTTQITNTIITIDGGSIRGAWDVETSVVNVDNLFLSNGAGWSAVYWTPYFHSIDYSQNPLPPGGRITAIYRLEDVPPRFETAFLSVSSNETVAYVYEDYAIYEPPDRGYFGLLVIAYNLGSETITNGYCNIRAKVEYPTTII